LAYIEWFTPFSIADTTTGFYTLSRSTRRYRRHAVIVPATDIVQSCYLIPHWG
ncbi:hypothetical protein OBBRIDRAFT_692968, partial [Obba rivulosa]